MPSIPSFCQSQITIPVVHFYSINKLKRIQYPYVSGAQLLKDGVETAVQHSRIAHGDCRCAPDEVRVQKGIRAINVISVHCKT